MSVFYQLDLTLIENDIKKIVITAHLGLEVISQIRDNPWISDSRANKNKPNQDNNNFKKDNKIFGSAALAWSL